MLWDEIVEIKAVALFEILRLADAHSHFWLFSQTGEGEKFSKSIWLLSHISKTRQELVKISWWGWAGDEMTQWVNLSFKRGDLSLIP